MTLNSRCEHTSGPATSRDRGNVETANTSDRVLTIALKRNRGQSGVGD